MAFGRSTAPVATDGYGTPAARSNKMHRPAIMANHVLHWISSLIVMSIAAYFIHHFRNNTHLVYWLVIVRFPLTCTILHLPFHTTLRALLH